MSPASTFKIPLSLMGFDSGILKTPPTPAWPYMDEYRAWNEQWKQTTDPTSWLRDSVVWYSQQLTRTMGFARFKWRRSATAIATSPATLVETMASPTRGSPRRCRSLPLNKWP